MTIRLKNPKGKKSERLLKMPHKKKDRGWGVDLTPSHVYKPLCIQTPSSNYERKTVS